MSCFTRVASNEIRARGFGIWGENGQRKIEFSWEVKEILTKRRGYRDILNN